MVGFLAGGAFLWAVDKILPHLHLGFPREEAEGIKTTWHRSVLLVLAITLHNIPEGLAVGVAFGAVAAGVPSATLGGGGGPGPGHRHPELPRGPGGGRAPAPGGLVAAQGASSTARLRASSSRSPACSAPPAVLWMRPILPYALSFAAGARGLVCRALIVRAHGIPYGLPNLPAFYESPNLFNVKLFDVEIIAHKV